MLLVCKLLSSDKIIARMEKAYTDGYKKVLTAHQPNSSNCIDIIVHSSTCHYTIYIYCYRLVLNLSHNSLRKMTIVSFYSTVIQNQQDKSYVRYAHSYINVFHHFQKPILTVNLINLVGCQERSKVPKVHWTLYDWYPEGWWESKDLNCSHEQMNMVLERAISF